MTKKYIKLTYNKDKPWAYVIIKDAEQKMINGIWGWCGKLVYGSRREYNTAGKFFNFGNGDKIEELEEEWVVRNHFAGLL